MNHRILLWDLEFMNLNANFGFIFCGGIKEYKGKTKVLSISDYRGWRDDPSNDKKLVSDIAAKLSEADLWVTWYGKRCDVPYLNTRLLFHRLPPLPAVHHIDGWETARRHLKMHSNRLASLQDFLGVNEKKTSIAPSAWLKACGGDKASLNYITHHCYKDVEVLEEVYERLLPFIKDPAVRNERGACLRCGSLKLQSRGFIRSTVNIKPRFQCMSCGGWMHGKAVRNSGATFKPC
jgi:uncharacterized protein YprB with RNaseH-like and TPR domain